MTKLSVIIPVYNVENYIDRCLNSVIEQTIEDIEIIIVNDGSTDSSQKIIEKYINQYPNRIKYLEKENGGLSSARNFALPYAKGEYIAFLDSDDYIEKDMYEQMYNKAIEEDADLVECDFIWEYPNKKRLDIGKEYSNKKEAIEKARVVAWNKLYRREIIKKHNLKFPEGLRYEDVEFFYKFVPFIEKISFVRKCFVHYTQRQNSIANTQNSKTRDIFNALDNVIEFYKQNGIYDEYKDQLEYIYTRFLLCSSLKRMCKISNKKERNLVLQETWKNINSKFPLWRNNKILKQFSLKNLYIKSNNKITYKIYCLFLILF